MKKVLKGFSEKIDGSMYLSAQNPLAENVANRKRFLEMKNLGGRKIVVAGLVHGSAVQKVDAGAEYIIPDTDALVTQTPEMILTLTGADCFPVYFEEKTAGIVGLAHCGWKGIVGGIVNNTVGAIVEMGGKTENIVMTIGPGICTKHFEIKEDILSSFEVYPEYILREERISVDLKGIIKKQATESGIVSENILDTNECTYCLDEKYFSYRRDKSDPLEAQIAYIVQFPHRKF